MPSSTRHPGDSLVLAFRAMLVDDMSHLKPGEFRALYDGPHIRSYLMDCGFCRHITHLITESLEQQNNSNLYLIISMCRRRGDTMIENTRHFGLLATSHVRHALETIRSMDTEEVKALVEICRTLSHLHTLPPLVTDIKPR